MKQIAWVFLGWFVLFISAQAASFDCRKASTKTEKIICGDDELSKLDESLSKLYQQVIERREDKQRVTKEQKKWLKEVRDVCQEAACLKDAYEARAHELADILQRPAYVHSSYFMDTPVRSFDEMMDGCFADSACAAQAKVLMPAYSKQSNISESDLREILKDCIAAQQTMNICAGYELFVIENEMSWALQEATRDSPPACRRSIQEQQAAWERRTRDKCSEKADEDEDYGRGSARSGIEMSCNTDALKTRIEALELAGSCQPCSKCLELP